MEDKLKRMSNELGLYSSRLNNLDQRKLDLQNHSDSKIMRGSHFSHVLLLALSELSWGPRGVFCSRSRALGVSVGRSVGSWGGLGRPEIVLGRLRAVLVGVQVKIRQVRLS